MIEAWDLYAMIRKYRDFPWRKRDQLPAKPYAVSVVLRLGLGMGLCAAFGASGLAAGPVGFLSVGVAAVKVLEQLSRYGLNYEPPQAIDPGPQPPTGGPTDAP
jgi:hypothetical protein